MNLSIALALTCGCILGCGGTPPSESGATTVPSTNNSSEHRNTWQDWKTYTNVSPGAWISRTHGKRFVEIYVNDVGLQAYKTPGEAMPVGSIVIKPSWENHDGSPGDVGPLFIMEKMPQGYAPEHDDWFYAFQWKNAPAKWQDKNGNDPNWQSPTSKVDYCSGCHDSLDRGLGMPPKEREWM